MKKIKGFTLLEMIICTVLAGIVIFAVYAIVISANKSYLKLHENSRNRNNIVYLKNLVRKSVTSTNLAINCSTGTNCIRMGYFDINLGTTGNYRIDEYNFDNNILTVVTSTADFKKEINNINVDNLSTSNSASISLNVYKGMTTSKYDYLNKSTTTYINYTSELLRQEKVLNNVNKVICFLEKSEAINTNSEYNVEFKYIKAGLYMYILYDTASTGESHEYNSNIFVFNNKNTYEAKFSTRAYTIL